MELEKYLHYFQNIDTPFYFYDCELLQKTFESAKLAAEVIPNSMVHLAIKSNNHPRIIKQALLSGFGIDAVSGGEIEEAINSGIPGSKIVFAGVGKTDNEISYAIKNDILCFNVESIPEIHIINKIAKKANKQVKISLRINPNVDAHTHKNITTGLAENKFGLEMDDIVSTITLIDSLENVHYYGLHFHIGSQILDMSCFEQLSKRINEIQDNLEKNNIYTESINVGGGLGVNYNDPQNSPLPQFQNYFDTFKKNLKLRPHQIFHCELGRALTAQYGALISKVVYIKECKTKKFAIVDAGFTDLIRPSLYHAYHKAINLTSIDSEEIYDIVGPICESTDVFEENAKLPKTKRGDIIAFLSAGAYGHVMASTYNCRKLIKEITSEDF